MRRNQQSAKASHSTDVLTAQIAAVRDECHRAVEVLSSRRLMGRAKLAECARLGDSLEAAQRFLKSAVAHIVIANRKRQNAADY